MSLASIKQSFEESGVDFNKKGIPTPEVGQPFSPGMFMSGLKIPFVILFKNMSLNAKLVYGLLSIEVEEPLMDNDIFEFLEIPENERKNIVDELYNAGLINKHHTQE
ncbi:hypothetical protein LCGC14_1485170 [marine sediment metagenome]|uniref:Uncharacterized protein n=1 Tax=marine sediment metagenome TaxID=412755 RepID=A0A0F9MA90_9ZZZZ